MHGLRVSASIYHGRPECGLSFVPARRLRHAKANHVSPLNAARGIVIAIGLSACLWAALILLL